MAKKSTGGAAVPETGGAPKFSLAQIQKSKRFSPMEKSILGVVLDSGGEYTIDAAKAAIQNFMKKEVV